MKPKTNVIFYRDPDLKGIDICRVCDSRHSFPEHFHEEFYIIGLIASGTCYCLGHNQRDALAGPGGVTLVNPGQIHSGVPVDQGQLSYTMCHISTRTMYALALELGLPPTGHRNSLPPSWMIPESPPCSKLFSTP